MTIPNKAADGHILRAAFPLSELHPGDMKAHIYAKKTETGTFTAALCPETVFFGNYPIVPKQGNE